MVWSLALTHNRVLALTRHVLTCRGSKSSHRNGPARRAFRRAFRRALRRAFRRALRRAGHQSGNGRGCTKGMRKRVMGGREACASWRWTARSPWQAGSWSVSGVATTGNPVQTHSHSHRPCGSSAQRGRASRGVSRCCWRDACGACCTAELMFRPSTHLLALGYMHGYFCVPTHP